MFLVELIFDEIIEWVRFVIAKENQQNFYKPE
jgi:hypothetical protein